MLRLLAVALWVVALAVPAAAEWHLAPMAGATVFGKTSLVDFAVPAGQVDNVKDFDAAALLGIAITAADNANGAWSYSLNGGASWVALFLGMGEGDGGRNQRGRRDAKRAEH